MHNANRRMLTPARNGSKKSVHWTRADQCLVKKCTPCRNIRVQVASRPHKSTAHSVDEPVCRRLLGQAQGWCRQATRRTQAPEHGGQESASGRRGNRAGQQTTANDSDVQREHAHTASQGFQASWIDFLLVCPGIVQYLDFAMSGRQAEHDKQDQSMLSKSSKSSSPSSTSGSSLALLPNPNSALISSSISIS